MLIATSTLVAFIHLIIGGVVWTALMYWIAKRHKSPLTEAEQEEYERARIWSHYNGGY